MNTQPLPSFPIFLLLSGQYCIRSIDMEWKFFFSLFAASFIFFLARLVFPVFRFILPPFFEELFGSSITSLLLLLTGLDEDK